MQDKILKQWRRTVTSNESDDFVIGALTMLLTIKGNDSKLVNEVMEILKTQRPELADKLSRDASAQQTASFFAAQADTRGEWGEY